MKRPTLHLILCIFALLSAATSPAATQFWDANGTTGCGGSGNWGSGVLQANFWGTACDTGLNTWVNGNDASLNGTVGTLTLTNGVTVGKITASAGTYTIAGGQTLTFSGAGAGVDVAGSFQVALNCIYAGSLLTKSGVGRLQLNNSGATVSKYLVNAGHISTAAITRFGTAPGSLVADFMRFNGGGWGIDTGNQDTGANRGITIDAGGATFSATASTTIMTLSAPVTGVGGITIGAAAVTHTAGPILVLNNTGNNFGGNISIASGGTLRVGVAGSVPDTAIVTIATGTVFDLNNLNETVRGISGTAGSMNLGTGTLTIDTASGTQTFTSTVSGTGGKIVKNGAGAQVLGGSSTYSGGLTLNGGAFGIGGNAAPGTGTLTINNSPTIAANNTSTRVLTVPVQLNGNVTFDDTLNAGPGALNFSTGAWTLSAGNHTITVSRAAGSYTCTIGSIIGEAATAGIIKAGARQLNLTNNNTYTGDTTINDGSLQISALTALGTTAGKTVVNSGGALSVAGVTGTISEPIELAGPGNASFVTLDINASSSATFDSTVKLNDNATVAVTGTGAATFSAATAFTAVGKNLTIQGGAGAGVKTISGDIALAGGGLTKAGGGTWILSGVNSYTGPTAVTLGTLLVNSPGSLNAGSTVTVSSAATLGGTGTIGGPTTVQSGGFLAPGASIGALTFTTAPTLGGTTVMELNKAAGPVLTSDKLVVSPGGGTLAYGGALTLSFSGLAITNTDTFDLFDADAFSGSFTSITPPGAGLLWDTSQLTVNGTITAVCDGTLVANAGANQTTCGGTGVTIGGAPTATGGSGVYTYLWSPSTGLSSATVANPVASPTSTTIYTVTVTDSVGCTATSGNVTVTVDNTLPAISVQPSNQAACEGSTASFSVTASAPGALSYKWIKNDNSGWGSVWSTSGSGATFRGSATDNNFGDPGCTSFSAANDINSPSGNALGMWGGFSGDQEATRSFGALSVGQVASIDIDNGNIDSGSKVGFSLQTAAGADVLQFYFLGGAANYKYNDGAEQDTGVGFQRNGVRVQIVLNTSTAYHLIVTPCGGTATHIYGTYAGTIAKLKVFNQNNTGGSDKNIYFNNILLGGYADNADNYGGDYAGLDKGAQPIGAGNGGSTYVTPTLTVADSGAQYQVVVSSCSGSIISSLATLTVNPRPTSVVSGNATICNGDSALISAALTGTGPWNVTWSDAVTQTGVTVSPATRTVSPTLTTVYTVTALTDANCTAQAGDRTGSATLTVNTLTANTTTYQRAAGSSLKIYLSALLTNASDTLAQTITFIGAGTDGFNLTSTNSVTITTNATFIGYPGGATPNVNDSFKYKVTDVQGCTTLGTVLINTVPNPGGLGQVIATGAGTVTVTFSGIPGYQYDIERAEDANFTVNVTTLITTNAPPNGQFSYTDGPTPPLPSPSAYYRLKYNP